MFNEGSTRVPYSGIYQSVLACSSIVGQSDRAVSRSLVPNVLERVKSSDCFVAFAPATDASKSDPNENLLWFNDDRSRDASRDCPRESPLDDARDVSRDGIRDFEVL